MIQRLKTTCLLGELEYITLVAATVIENSDRPPKQTAMPDGRYHDLWSAKTPSDLELVDGSAVSGLVTFQEAADTLALYRAGSHSMT
jgi:hypothetical protein